MAEVAHLARAADPGDRAGEAEHGDDLPSRPHPRVARGARRVADHLRLEPEPCPRVEHPDADRDGDRDEDAEGNRERAERRDRPVGGLPERLALREDRAGRRGVAPVREAVEDQVVEDERGDVVEHQRRDDLVGVRERPQEPRDRAPRRAARRADDDHRRDDDERGLPVEVERDPGGADRAEVELALGADVEEAHPEGDRGGEAGEGERRRRDERVGERAVGEERGVEEPPERRDRRVAGRGEDDRDRTERDGQRAERHGDREPAALDEALLDPDRRSRQRTPAIRRPELVDVGRPAVGLARDRALVHDDDPVGEREHLVEVLADQEHPDARPPPRRAGGRGRSRSRRRRAPASARRPRAPWAARRTRGRGRPSAGCRPRACARARSGPSCARRSGGSARARGRGSAGGAGTAHASRRRRGRT